MYKISIKMDYNQNNVDKVDKVIKTVWKSTLKGAKKIDIHIDVDKNVNNYIHNPH